MAWGEAHLASAASPAGLDERVHQSSTIHTNHTHCWSVLWVALLSTFFFRVSGSGTNLSGPARVAKATRRAQD